MAMRRYLQFDYGVATGELHAPERGRFDEASMPEGRVMVDVTERPDLALVPDAPVRMKYQGDKKVFAADEPGVTFTA